MKNKEKFQKIWANQTKLGKMFGLSSIAVGKILIANDLKSQTTKLATEKAIQEGYATSTPLKDGTPYYMWNVGKIKPLIAKITPQLSKAEQLANEINLSYHEAHKLIDEGQDKIGFMMLDFLFSDVPKELLPEVRAIVAREINLEEEGI